MGDSFELSRELVKEFGFLWTGNRPKHGGFDQNLDTDPTLDALAVDLCLLRDSHHNFHINAWRPWWSGFSHYTSRIFEIPSTNFRTPGFAREEISAKGDYSQHKSLLAHYWEKLHALKKRLRQMHLINK
jgi:hypothetical protein